jgi:copper chaperone NosL
MAAPEAGVGCVTSSGAAPGPRTPRRGRVAPLVVLALGGLAACAEPAPRPLVMGDDECSHCHMRTADARYAAELVTRTGRIYVFDDPGCLAAYLNAGSVADDQVHSLWVADFLRPDSLVAVEDAVFLRADTFRSPMSYGVAAFAAGPAADSAARAANAERLDWGGVRAALAAGRAPHAPPAAPGS